MHCLPRNLLWLLIALLGSFHLLSACGQKGPLYLPPDEETPASEQETQR
jgi:predicted small lipoprotein YifL